MKLSTFLFVVIAFAFACSSAEVATSSPAEVSNLASQAIPSETPRILTEEDMKKKNEVEKKMLNEEYLHDGSLELAEIGDMNSVPALLVVLRKYPSKGKAVVCTKVHALMALRKITGENLGNQVEDWEPWWEARKETK